MANARSQKRYLRAYGDELNEKIATKRQDIIDVEEILAEMKRDLEADEAEYNELFRPTTAAARAEAVARRCPAASSGAVLSLKKPRIAVVRSRATQTD